LYGELQACLRECAGVEVEPYVCFNGCSYGPNVVFHADRVWYEGVDSADVDAL
jgi:(2Fe-2S) ferredoxin